MIRELDKLGRVVIPKEMRKELNIEGGDPINIELQNNKVIITKPDAVDYKAIVEEATKFIEDVYNSLENVDRPILFYENILDILNGKKD